MASLQHKESYRLKPSDRARKSDDLFPFFGSDTVHRIQLITALGIDLLYICLKRFPGIGVCVLNLVGQQNSCHFPDSGLRFQASIKLSYCSLLPGRGLSVNSPVSVSTISMLCCRACGSQPTIFISASFVPSLFGWTPESLLGLFPGRRCYEISHGRLQTPISVCAIEVEDLAASLLRRSCWGQRTRALISCHVWKTVRCATWAEHREASGVSCWVSRWRAWEDIFSQIK